MKCPACEETWVLRLKERYLCPACGYTRGSPDAFLEWGEQCPYCRGKGKVYDTEWVGSVLERSGPSTKCRHCGGTGKARTLVSVGNCRGCGAKDIPLDFTAQPCGTSSGPNATIMVSATCSRCGALVDYTWASMGLVTIQKVGNWEFNAAMTAREEANA